MRRVAEVAQSPKVLLWWGEMRGESGEEGTRLCWVQHVVTEGLNINDCFPSLLLSLLDAVASISGVQGPFGGL
jgi:hypothetical protein